MCYSDETEENGSDEARVTAEGVAQLEASKLQNAHKRKIHEKSPKQIEESKRAQ